MDRQEITRRLEEIAETCWDYGYDEMYFSEMSFIEDVVSFILDNFEEKPQNKEV